MRAIMFEEVSEANSQFIHLSDCNGRAAAAEWIIGQGTRAIGWAVMAYAKQRDIALDRVQYATRPYRERDARNRERGAIVDAMQPKGA